MFFEVIPTEIFRDGTSGILTYAAPQGLNNLQPGHIVLIPLGQRAVPGIIFKRVQRPDFPTKPIIKLLVDQPLPAHLLKAIRWLSDYYLAPLPTVASLLLPNFTKTTLKPSTAPEKLPKTSPETTETPKIAPIPLNQNQQNALKALSEAPGATRLLRGVTGSGKTNIYLKMAADALKTQNSTILLVPEIALTPQLVQIFEQTFGSCVHLIHSNQTPAERRKTWLSILAETSAGNPVIVVGPRSALFAPVHNLSLIIIDEAHESAYHQENAPRYSALRLASFIAASSQTSHQKISCLLGTATPNVVDYHLARSKNSLVELTEKAKTAAIDPDITVVDLKKRENFLKNRYFSNQLLDTITKNLAAHHQTLIFHNRRGSSPLTICEDCGWQALCPDCYLPMTLHAEEYVLTCHLCGHSARVPSSCPNCQKPGIIHKGFGTKLLESELKKLFPAAKIARFDGDNKKADSLASLYDDIKNGDIDILIGTQTLARGLDLPHLASVGIVQADAGLSLPDFAAPERTFQLLTQVLGRIGRGHLDSASAIIQTYQPDHFAIQSALQADYPAFAEQLLKTRSKQHLPPFTFLARLAITYKTERTTYQKIRQAYVDLAENPRLKVSHPIPAFHEYGSGGYTWQLTLTSTSRTTLVDALKPYQRHHIDLDPPSLL